MPAENKKIFPPAIIEYSVEKHFSRYNPRSRALYLTVLGVFFLGIILLFIIKVDVTVRSTGIIRPLQERTDIRSAINGVIDSLYVVENMHVQAGQVVMKIKSGGVDEKGIALAGVQNELQAEVEDLRKLAVGKFDNLKSSLYTQQYSLYKQKLNDVQVRYNLVSKNYGRYATLYNNKVISASEYDKYTYEKKAVESEMSLTRQSQLSLWQADLLRLERQLEESSASLSVYEGQKDLYTIKAPVSGTVQSLKGIQVGSFVSPNEILGEISPDSGLIAEAYIPSKDIGLIKIGNSVRMQVDAFNYSSWGMLDGKVLSISSDIYTDAAQPYFKVRCMLTQQVLTLKNGYQGFVKKGMTIQARFLITERTLFQLLYDQTDDWLNPNIVKNAKDKS